MSRHIVGSVCVEMHPGGNLIVSNTHTPNRSVIIERADIDDLRVAMDAALGEVVQPPPNQRDLTPAWFVEALNDLAQAIAINTGKSAREVDIVVRRDFGIRLGIPPMAHVRVSTAAGQVLVRNGDAWTSGEALVAPERGWRREYLGQWVPVEPSCPECMAVTQATGYRAGERAEFRCTGAQCRWRNGGIFA